VPPISRAPPRALLLTLQRGGFVMADGKLFSLKPHVFDARVVVYAVQSDVTVCNQVLRSREDAGNKEHLLARSARLVMRSGYREKQPGADVFRWLEIGLRPFRPSEHRSAAPCSAARRTELAAR